MNTAEYDNLAGIEDDHWFYRGKREIVRHWISRCAPPEPDDLLVDCGAGSGRFAAEMATQCRVLAIDDHEEAMRLAKQRLGESQVRAGSCTSLPCDNASVDILTALDVVEHVEDDNAAMEEFKRVLKPNGLMVITVPALQALWSDWDVVLHHYRRYEKHTLRRLVERPGLELIHWNFLNFLALPAVFAVRKFRALRPAQKPESVTRVEDKIPPRLINELLRASFVGCGCQSLVRFPAGVSLLAVVRRV